MRRYREAEHYACDVLEPCILDGQLDFPEYTFADAVIGFSSGANLKKDAHGILYYDVSEPLAEALVSLSDRDYRFFDICCEISGVNIRSGASLPLPLRLHASSFLRGRVSRPTPSHRPKAKNWLQRSFIWSLTKTLAADYYLELTRNDWQKNEKLSACDAVARALTVCGVKTKYSEIKQLMVGTEHKELRAEFSAASNLYNRAQEQIPTTNALSSEYHKHFKKQADLDVLAIQRAFNAEQK